MSLCVIMASRNAIICRRMSSNAKWRIFRVACLKLRGRFGLKHSKTRSMSKTQKSFIEIRIWFVLSRLSFTSRHLDTENGPSIRGNVIYTQFGNVGIFRGDIWLELIYAKVKFGWWWMKNIPKEYAPQIQFGKSLIYLIKRALTGQVFSRLSLSLSKEEKAVFSLRWRGM